jgi:hypothetical protein
MTQESTARLATVQTRDGEYTVLIAGRVVTITNDRGFSLVHEPEHWNQRETDMAILAQKPSFRIGYTCLESGFHIIHCYDDEQEWQFGYSINLDADDLSEWGDTCIKDWAAWTKLSPEDQDDLRGYPSVIVATTVQEVVLGVETVPAQAVTP